MSFLSKLNRDNPQKPHLYKWSATSVKQWCCKAKGVSYYGTTIQDAYFGWANFVYVTGLKDGPGKIKWDSPASK